MNKRDSIAIIRSILTSSKTSLSVSQLNRDFRNETGVDIPLFGYQTVSDFLHSIPDTVKMEGIYPIETVSLVQNFKSGHILSLVKRQRNSGDRRKALSKCQNQPVGDSPLDERGGARNGESEKLPCMKKKKKRFPSNFRKNCPVNIPEKDTVNYKRNAGPFVNETHCAVKEEEPLGGKCTGSSQTVAVKEEIILSKPLMENEYNIRSSISFMNIKHYAKIGSYMEVCLCKIYSPDHFYFRLREYKFVFRNLLERMMTFYSMNHELPHLPQENVKVGQVCAVYYTGLGNQRMLWHRGEIIGLESGPQVLVTLVDYRETVGVLKNEIKYLYGDFGELPRQAFFGSLANIRPPNGQRYWTKKATNRFISLTFEKELVAGVVSVNEEESSVNMALTCTKGKEIHINDVLVEEGHADFGRDDPDATSGENFNTRLTHTRKDLLEENIDYTKTCEKSVEEVEEKHEEPSYSFGIFENNNKRLMEMFAVRKMK